MIKLGVFVALALTLSFSNFTEAKSRNCTKEEKQLANERLLAIEKSDDLKREISKLHLPFGEHETLSEQANEELLYQMGYVLKHDADLKTTLWTSYSLTKQDLERSKGNDRVNCFRADPRLDKQDSARPSDYKEKIFDQGHVTNDADLKDELLDAINSYVYTNQSPQYCRFNRGIWLSLEHLVRIWAKSYDEKLYVISGAIFDKNDDNTRDLDSEANRMRSNNGKQRVAVPTDFYKVIVRALPSGRFTSISFLLEHNNDKQGVKWNDVKPNLRATVVDIETIEDKADILLMPMLDRSKLHQDVNDEYWSLEVGKSNMSSRCKDITE